MLKNTLVALVLIYSFTGCLKSSTQTCDSNYDPCAVKAPASEIQDVQNYLTSNSITAIQHCSGLFYTIDAPGTGKTPNVCSDITVNYKGTLTNGNVFDSTSTSIGFNLSGVIAGWKDGLPLISEGGKIHLYIPPSLGYGGYTVGTIPPNSILVYEVELVSVQ